MPQYDQSLGPREFERAFTAVVTEMMAKDWAWWVLTGPNKEKAGQHTPLGLVAARVDGYHILPKVLWFPWASHRNRVECVVRWLNEVRKTSVALFHVKQMENPAGRPIDAWKFYKRICRYGVLRPIGLVKNWFGPDPSFAYQTVKPADV